MTKEEAIKILTGYMGGKIDPESTELYYAIELAVDILESQPSLPSNLDEAAEKGAYKYCVDNKIGEYCGAAVYDAYEAGHKAGAEWMAGQGAVEAYCIESSNPVSESPEQRLHCIRLIYEEKEDAPYVLGGDKVIIQIRKKKIKK